MHPIFINSKDRPQSSTLKLLTDAGLPFHLILEPQDAEKYLAVYPSAIIVPAFDFFMRVTDIATGVNLVPETKKINRVSGASAQGLPVPQEKSAIRVSGVGARGDSVPEKKTDMRVTGVTPHAHVSAHIHASAHTSTNASAHAPAPRVILLPDSNLGLAFARQFTLDQARAAGLDWYWLLDDDIKSFYTAANGKTQKCEPLAALELAESFFPAGGLGLAQAGLEYQQFAWSAKKPFKFNSYADVAVCINAKLAAANYCLDLPFKSDRDFTLQLLAAGLDVMKISRVAFAAPKNGTNAGGLCDLYKTDAEKRASQMMCDRWGANICQPHTKNDGRPDVKINWNAFKHSV